MIDLTLTCPTCGRRADMCFDHGDQWKKRDRQTHIHYRMTEHELRAAVNEFTEDDPPPYSTREALVAGERVTIDVPVDPVKTASKAMLRWSSVRSCPRKAVYEWEGAPVRDRTRQEEGWLWRGKSLGRDYTCFLATEQGKRIAVASGHNYWVPPDLRALETDELDNLLVAEAKIEWAYGVGHADIYIPETKTIVEILSSAHASAEATRSKLLQLVGYVEHHPDAENGALVIINPSDFTQERIVLSPTSRQYQELAEDVRVRVAQLDQWAADRSKLPARVCAKPDEARQHFCRHAEHCFADWTPPPAEEVEASVELIEALDQFALQKSALAELAARAKTHEAWKKDAQAIIEAADLPPGRLLRVGPFEVTRTAVQRKPTFEWEKAEMAGLFEPGLYGDFFKPGASYSTFKANRVEMTDAYGDSVPF